MIFESAVSAFIGLIGSAFTAYTNYKNKQLEIEDKKAQRAHEIALITAQTQATIEEAKAQIQIVQAQTAAAIDLADAGTFNDSVKGADKSLISSEWINHMLNGNKVERFLAAIIVALLGLAEYLKDIMRPTLTMYLCGLSTWMTLKAYELYKISGNIFTLEQLFAILNNSYETTNFLFITMVTWWFGDRAMSKFLQGRLKKVVQ